MTEYNDSVDCYCVFSPLFPMQVKCCRIMCTGASVLIEMMSDSCGVYDKIYEQSFDVLKTFGRS